MSAPGEKLALPPPLRWVINGIGLWAKFWLRRVHPAEPPADTHIRYDIGLSSVRPQRRNKGRYDDYAG